LTDPSLDRSRWVWLAATVPVAVTLDQLTKQVAEDALFGRPIVTVVEGVLLLTYARNKGAFFSLGESLPDGLRRTLFMAATLGATAVMIHLYRRAADGRWAFRWALIALLAGALGNLVDRLLYGEVIDFMHLHYRDDFHWATFNVADIYICIALVLLLVDVLRPNTEAGPHTSRTT
jgi:signal peptidase II